MPKGRKIVLCFGSNQIFFFLFFCFRFISHSISAPFVFWENKGGGDKTGTQKEAHGLTGELNFSFPSFLNIIKPTFAAVFKKPCGNALLPGFYFSR